MTASQSDDHRVSSGTWKNPGYAWHAGRHFTNWMRSVNYERSRLQTVLEMQQCRVACGVERCQDGETSPHTGTLIVSGSVDATQSVEQGAQWNDTECKLIAIWRSSETG